MGGFGLSLDLVDSVILSRETDAAGGSAPADCLPGSHLLGAAAAALYRHLTREEAWLLFHSGKVRFGNGFPKGPGDEVAWPAPLCWRNGPEVRLPVLSGMLRPEQVWNLMDCADDEPTRSFPAAADGYVTESGYFVRPRCPQRAGTAMASARGRPARFGHLGYGSLAEGQSFVAEITWDDDVPSPLAERLESFFEETPVLLLGRSRSAQYGRVACRRVPVPLRPRSAWPAGRELRIWLLSDLAACDVHGFPTLAPSASDLGLPPAEPVPHQTHRRFRVYSPFNGFHGLYGQERQVISQGSVLTYRLHNPCAPEEGERLRSSMDRGLGLYRESGLGRAIPAPALLTGPHPEFTPVTSSPAEFSPDVPDHPMAHWLLALTESHSVQGGLKRWAEQSWREFEQLEKNARRLNGLGEDQSAAPGKPQWGRVLEAAERALRATDGYARLHRELFTRDGAICGLQDEDWGRPTAYDDGRQLAYREWLERKLAEHPDAGPRALALLAGCALRRLGARD